MRFKTVSALSGILILTGAAIDAQTVSRWLRLPYNSAPPAILRHSLGAPQSPGFNFQFSYEKTPVRPLERLINRGIPEAAPARKDAEDIPGMGQNALKLEELNREADEVLANPPASTSFTHLFLQQQKEPTNASQSKDIASISSELPEKNTASGTAPAYGVTGLPDAAAEVKTASGTAAGK